ncbi:MAG TPA: hypothetical protein VGM23_17765 [Armatimonadota bacterium]|jgi:hypothetical protein
MCYLLAAEGPNPVMAYRYDPLSAIPFFSQLTFTYKRREVSIPC